MSFINDIYKSPFEMMRFVLYVSPNEDAIKLDRSKQKIR